MPKGFEGFQKGISVSPATQFKKGQIPHNKGKKTPREQVEKMRQAKLKNPSRYWLGKKRSLEDRAKFSKSHIGLQIGARNGLWKGGITPINKKIRHSQEYKLWRTAVFERDNYTCIWGGKEHGHDIQADHIKPFAYFPELRFAIDNGRMLCKNCHKTTDTYGNKAKLGY